MAFELHYIILEYSARVLAYFDDKKPGEVARIMA